MEKKLVKYSLVFVFTLFSGALIFQYYNNAEKGSVLGPPEGYEETVDRVEKLKIDGSVSEYYDENIDLVAFGPGSGWLKFKTRDGLSPVLSFNRVKQSDIRQFNRFSKGIGLPIRVAFSNRVLRISSIKAGDNHVQMADITVEKLGKDSIMVKGFEREESRSRLVLRKDENGKVYLVKRDEQERVPDTLPSEEVLVAKK
jgi:hypothetical protein